MVDERERERWYDFYAPSEHKLRAEFEEKLERARFAKERRKREKEEREERRKEEKEKPGQLFQRRRGFERGEKGEERERGAKEWSPRAAGRTLGRHHLGETPKNFLEILEEVKASHPDLELVENQPGSEPEEIEDIIGNVEKDLEEASSDQHGWFQEQSYVWDYLPEGNVAIYFINGREMDLTYLSPEAVEAAL